MKRTQRENKQSEEKHVIDVTNETVNRTLVLHLCGIPDVKQRAQQ